MFNKAYFIILKNLCMPNLRFFILFILGGKNRFSGRTPWGGDFLKKLKCTSFYFFIRNNVLTLSFSYVERYVDKNLWKKYPLGHVQKIHFLLTAYLVDYFVKNLFMYFYDFFRYFTFLWKMALFLNATVLPPHV